MGGRQLVVFILGTALLALLVAPAPAAAATYSYVTLEPGTPTESNATTFAVPVFAFYEPGGGPTNSMATKEIAYNLEVEYVGSGAPPRVNWTASAVATGSFQLVLVLTAAQTTAVEEGAGVVSLNATLLAPTGGTISASGVIGKSTLSGALGPSTWWETWFGATTPPPDTDSIGGIFAFLAWLDATTTGRALYMLTTLVAVSLYLYEAHKLTRARIATRHEGRRG